MRIIQGTGSVRNFVAAVTSHFNHYKGVDGFIEALFLEAFCLRAGSGSYPVYTELLSVHRESVPLWTSIFSLLLKVTNINGRNRSTGAISIIIPLTFHAANTIYHCTSVWSEKKCTDLVSCWVAADFFDILDVIIPFYTLEPLDCSFSHRIFLSKLTNC
jgi:hypothetical protein